ncbi:MAG: rhomboid family intramembrane serine protease [Draconibacterium sp.]|nr:MAG: rhomboid family intramembrane serine protease [Draconibacterium sp.]
MPLFRYYPNNPKRLDPELEKRIFFHSLVPPAVFVLVFWLVKIAERALSATFVQFGVYPLHVKGLPGILFSPFIHSDFNHLISNSIPFFILMWALVYFYRRISYRIFFQLYLLTGVCLWIFGRESWHIGASGVVYAMAAFHFLSGIIRNDVRLLTLSVVVVFLYGGLIWGLFPIDPAVSWEGHLWGAISGIVLAFGYRKYTIRRDKFEWEEEDDDDDEDDINGKILNTENIKNSGNPIEEGGNTVAPNTEI